MALFIVDIDGTVANNDHRSHLLVKADGSKPVQEDWDAFLNPDLVALDPVIPRCKEVLSKLLDHSPDSYIIFLTGRSHKLHECTYQWLHKGLTELMPHSALITRSEKHARTRPVVYKSEMLEGIRADPRWVRETIMAFDDDPYMPAAYAKYGIVPFRAPDCWDILYPDSGDLPPEAAWRK